MWKISLPFNLWTLVNELDTYTWYNKYCSSASHYKQGDAVKLWGYIRQIGYNSNNNPALPKQKANP